MEDKTIPPMNVTRVASMMSLGCIVAVVSLLNGCSRSTSETKAPVFTGSSLSPQDVLKTPAASAASVVDLSGKDIAELPADSSILQHIKTLKIGGNERLRSLPAYISDLTELEELNIDNGNGYRMSLRLSDMNLLPKNLKKLNLSGALDNVSSLPISNLQELEELDLSHFERGEIPSEVFSLKNLKSLRLDYTGLREVSERISELSKLERLYLNCNGIVAENWPDLTKITNLRVVELGNNSFTKAEQELIRHRLPPSTKADFENLWDDARANEE